MKVDSVFAVEKCRSLEALGWAEREQANAGDWVVRSMDKKIN